MRNAFLALLACALTTTSAVAQTVTRLEVFPSERMLHAPNCTQQLAVIAHFADGTTRDVTRLTAFQSSDSLIAWVNMQGRVRFHQAGEVAIQCRYGTVQSVCLTYLEPKPGFVWPNPPIHHWIDQHVFAKLKQFDIAPAELCSDGVFIRRAFLDACGILPTPAEIRSFLADPRPDKRGRLINELLQRPEFADYWAHHFVEPLGLTQSYLEPKKGAAYLYWMRTQIAGDVPFDRIVRAMLLGETIVTDRGPVSYYTGGQGPADWANRTAANFLGVRLQCMQCHPHHHARWTPNDFHGFTAFFVQAFFVDVPLDKFRTKALLLDRQREWPHPQTREPVPPRFLDGTMPKLKSMQDRREVLADWMASPKNPYFARTFANRVWHHLLGKGIADPPETMHEQPISMNEPLLDALARECIDKRFDLKLLVRTIMNSRTYQLDAKTNAHNKDDIRYFSHAYTRPHKAEVVRDAISQFLELPGTYEGLVIGTRAVQTLYSPRPAFAFGGVQRLSECDGWDAAPLDRGTSLIQIIHEDELQKRLKVPHNRIGRLIAQKRTDGEIFDELWLAGLSKLPSTQLRKDVLSYLKTAKDRRLALEDLAWAVLASKEFLYRQ